MTDEELKALGEKVGNGTASPEEQLAFAAELNSVLSGIRTDIADSK